MAEVRDNRDQERFELEVGHATAFAAYTLDGSTIVFVHTMVPAGEQGHGVGSDLIAGALAIVRAQGLRVVPQCPFVANYIDHHPQWQNLLA